MPLQVLQTSTVPEITTALVEGTALEGYSNINLQNSPSVEQPALLTEIQPGEENKGANSASKCRILTKIRPEQEKNSANSGVIGKIR